MRQSFFKRGIARAKTGLPDEDPHKNATPEDGANAF